MKPTLALKIRLIYIPYIIITFSILAGYTALRYLINEKWNILPLSSNAWDIYLPLIISIFIVLKYLRPRLRILSLGGYNQNGFIIYNLAAIIAITIPVYHAQQYIATAPYKLHNINSLNDIDTNNVQKYYTIKNYKFDTNNGVMSALSWVSGGFRKNIEYSLLTATPVYDSIHPKFKVTYWYAYPFDTVVKKSTNRKKTETALTKFITDVRNNYDYFNPGEHQYFEVLRPSNEYYAYSTIIYTASTYARNHPAVILKPVFTPFNQRSGHSLLFTAISLFISTTTFFLMIFFPGVRLSAWRRFRAGTDGDSNELQHFLSYLVPGQNGLYVTPVIIWCCIILQMMIIIAHGLTALGSESIVLFGGNYLFGLIHGELWRLVTYMFLHADLYHLFSNMLFLGIAGAALEPLIRSWWLLGAYLFTGVAAGIASAFSNIYDVSTGASGAIFGLYGTMFGLLLMKYLPKRQRKKYSGLVWLYAGGGLIMSFQGNVDYVAHIGGLIAGIMFGIAYALIQTKLVLGNDMVANNN
ncbi:MAG: rhomboid family intramembrane serine protease [Flavipsychrobacter sp.]|nr:rhomboid family intramembrane serine protease [Flavipsychrobacter sp.]